jgi:hypothetical protein
MFDQERLDAHGECALEIRRLQADIARLSGERMVLSDLLLYAVRTVTQLPAQTPQQGALKMMFLERARRFAAGVSDHTA